MSLNFREGYDSRLGKSGIESMHFIGFAELVSGASHVWFPNYGKEVLDETEQIKLTQETEKSKIIHLGKAASAEVVILPLKQAEVVLESLNLAEAA